MREITLELFIIINGQYIVIKTSPEHIQIPKTTLNTGQTGYQSLNELSKNIFNQSIQQLHENNTVVIDQTLHPWSSQIGSDTNITLQYGLLIKTDDIDIQDPYKVMNIEETNKSELTEEEKRKTNKFITILINKGIS